MMPRRKLAKSVRSLALYVAPFVFLVLVWHLLASSHLLPTVWLPTPAAVAGAAQRLWQSGALQTNIGASLGNLLIGFAISVVAGISLGVAMGLRRGFADFIEPLVRFLNGLSGIVWIPLAVLWFGTGTGTVVFVVWNSVFFLVLFNTLVGVKAVPRVYEAGLLTMGASRWRLVRDVLIPGALPNIVTGLRVGMGFGWRALIAAEMFAASAGLGFMVYSASYYFQTSTIFAGLITIGSIWLLTDRLVFVPLENWTIRRWGLVT